MVYVMDYAKDCTFPSWPVVFAKLPFDSGVFTGFPPINLVFIIEIRVTV